MTVTWTLCLAALVVAIVAENFGNLSISDTIAEIGLAVSSVFGFGELVDRFESGK